MAPHACPEKQIRPGGSSPISWVGLTQSRGQGRGPHGEGKNCLLEPRCVSLLLTSGLCMCCSVRLGILSLPLVQLPLLNFKILWHHLLQEAPSMCFTAPHHTAISAEEQSDSEESRPKSQSVLGSTSDSAP